MTPPRRWLDDPRAPDGVADLLRHAGRTQGLPDAVYARSAARIARLGAAGTASSAAAAWLKPLAGLIAVGLAGAVATISLHHAPHEPLVDHPRVALSHAAEPLVAPVPSVALVPSVVPVPVVPALPVSAPAPVAVVPSVLAPSAAIAHAAPPASLRPVALRARPTVVRPSNAAPPAQDTALAAAPTAGGYVAPSVPIDDPLRHENLLLMQARDVLSTDPAEALRRLDAYDVGCPGHLLGDMRDFLSVQALLRLNRGDEARARGAASLQRYPRGLYNQALRRLLAAAPDARLPP